MVYSSIFDGKNGYYLRILRDNIDLRYISAGVRHWLKKFLPVVTATNFVTAVQNFVLSERFLSKKTIITGVFIYVLAWLRLGRSFNIITSSCHYCHVKRYSS